MLLNGPSISYRTVPQRQAPWMAMFISPRRKHRHSSTVTQRCDRDQCASNATSISYNLPPGHSEHVGRQPFKRTPGVQKEPGVATSSRIPVGTSAGALRRPIVGAKSPSPRSVTTCRPPREQHRLADRGPPVTQLRALQARVPPGEKVLQHQIFPVCAGGIIHSGQVQSNTKSERSPVAYSCPGLPLSHTTLACHAFAPFRARVVHPLAPALAIPILAGCRLLKPCP